MCSITDKITTVELLYGKNLRTFLNLDVKEIGPADVWVYNMELTFFEDLFCEFVENNDMRILCDYRARVMTAAFCLNHPRVSAKHWSKNGMLHSKCIIFPTRSVVYLGSHNFTWFAWNSGQNLTIRTTHKGLAGEVAAKFEKQWISGLPIIPDELLRNCDTLNNGRQQHTPAVPLCCDTEADSPATYRVSET